MHCFSLQFAERGTLMEPLKKVFEKSADLTGRIGFQNWHYAFKRLDAQVQWFMEVGALALH